MIINFNTIEGFVMMSNKKQFKNFNWEKDALNNKNVMNEKIKQNEKIRKKT